MQKMDEQEAFHFARELLSLYFEKRDMQTLSQYMEESISWIGTGQDELCRNFEEARNALAEELSECSSNFTVMDTHLNFVPFSDCGGIVYGMLEAVPSDPAVSVENIRFSVVLKQIDNNLKLLHVHFSHSDWEQKQGEYFVKQSSHIDNQSLRLELDLRNRQLDGLTRNIPGGVHQCRNNPGLTIVSMSDSFLAMFGYTREEIADLFHDNFIEMVYPEDRTAMLNTTCEQLKYGQDIELEYRVVSKNGAPVWILDKGRLMKNSIGEEYFYCVLVEITDRKQAQEELRLSLERHQVIMDQATDIIFEWDIGKDTLSFSPNWYKRFGYAAISEQISGRIPLSPNIHADDMSAFVKIMEDTAQGVPYSETEFRIKATSGKYYWCRIRATTQFDSDKRAIKAVGVIVDIDDEKKQAQVLLDMAQKDTLTGLYNKAAINSLVEHQMQENGRKGMQALFILDVDYFKLVNDTYGHLAGDSLLSDVAATIKKNIRQSDFAGRIGGDEFLVYLPEISSQTSAMPKAEKLFLALSLLTPERGAPPISCSIGVAVASYGELDYQAFYKCADLALYARKNNGRGGVTLYSAAIDKMPQDSTIVNSAVGNLVGSEENDIHDERLAQYTFRMLYAAKDVISAINHLLEIIGRSYDVSRAYIFEDSEDGLCCSNTFEWCAEGVEPQIARLQNILYLDELGDYKQNFDQSGVFYCANVNSTSPILRAVLEPQGIYSRLQCAMLDEGEFVGYVGFDECRENRTWTSKQMAGFKLTADVLSTFLIKLRQKQKNKRQRVYIEKNEIREK